MQNKREAPTSFLIVDAQSVKNTDTAMNKDYDGGKKVSGIKRHIALDTKELPHTIHITTANIGDRQGAERMLNKSKHAVTAVQNIIGDGGYTGNDFANAITKILSVDFSVEIATRNELHTFEVIPKRWVVKS